MNIHDATSLLLSEYPELKDSDLEILKQFRSESGRIFNTFLVKTTKPGLQRFIAKAFVHHPESLEKEWTVLRLLEKRDFRAPKLMIPDHKPIDFLLLEYIDGVTASQAIKQGTE